MASKSTFVCVALLVVLCFMLVNEPSRDCNGSGYYGCFFGDNAGFSEVYNRKVHGGVKEMKKYSVGNEMRELNVWELRKVPSGPDPLHHNGKAPKKPRSP